MSYLAAYDRIEANVKPSKPFVVGATTLTYGDLFDRVRRLTTFLPSAWPAPAGARAPGQPR